VHPHGAYNIRFRQGRAEVWMSGDSEETLLRDARGIAAAIAATG